MQAEELKSIAQRERETEAARTACINVCAAASCQALQSEELKKALTQAAAAQGYAAEEPHGAASVRHRHHVGIQIPDDPDRARDDDKDDPQAVDERDKIVRVVGPAAQMQKEDEVDANLR